VVTTLILTYNAGQHFRALLGGLQNQTLKPEQIVIVDSGSADHTRDIAGDYDCQIITIDRADFDHGTTRNLAMSQVTSEFAVFLTQDVLPVDEHLLAELVKPMQADSNIAMCYGRQLPKSHATALERFAREFNYPETSILKTRKDIQTMGLKTFFCSNSCSVIRRSIFNELGGFKNDVRVNEDMHFAAKAILRNYSVYYSATAKVYHSHSFSWLQTFRRYYSIGRFLAENQWILDGAGLKQYGGGMLRAGVRTFWQRRMPHYVAAFLLEFAVKAVAYELGRYYQRLFYKRTRS